MNNKNYIYIIILIIIFVLCTIFFPKKQINLVRLNNSDTFYAESVYDGIELEQEYEADKDYSGISFSVATYSKVFNAGTINISILDSNNKNILKRKIDMKSIDDSSLINIKYNLKKNKKYIIKITTKNIKKSSAITFGMINQDKTKIKYNDQIKKYSLDIRYIKYKKSYILIYYSLICLPLLYISYLSIVGGQNEKKN